MTSGTAFGDIFSLVVEDGVIALKVEEDGSLFPIGTISNDGKTLTMADEEGDMELVLDETAIGVGQQYFLIDVGESGPAIVGCDENMTWQVLIVSSYIDDQDMWSIDEDGYVCCETERYSGEYQRVLDAHGNAVKATDKVVNRASYVVLLR